MTRKSGSVGVDRTLPREEFLYRHVGLSLGALLAALRHGIQRAGIGARQKKEGK
jgi:hypothetical protein